MRGTKFWLALTLGATLFSSTIGLAGSATSGPYAVVTGRRDPNLFVIDISKAIDPANNLTDKAIVSRPRVSPNVPNLDSEVSSSKFIGIHMIPAQALPNNVILGPHGNHFYVVDHAGWARPVDVEAGMPHGYAGALTVMDVSKTLNPANSNTTNAIDAIYRTGGWGPAGVVVTQDDHYAFVANSEGPNSEDGALEIGLINLKTHELERVLLQAWGKGGAHHQPGHGCDEIKINPGLIPHSSPDINFGCFPNPNGLAYSPRGGGYIFSANEGTLDVGVINMHKAIAGDPHFEESRIPVASGPWAITTSPDGKYVAVTDRDNDQTDVPGQFISIIDVQRAINKDPHAEIRRVLVGTDKEDGGSHPFGLAFTPNGKYIVTACDLAGNISVVDLKKAVSGDPHPEIARIPVEAPPNGGPKPRPRGVAITPDSRYAVISGGPPYVKSGGVVWIIDLQTFKVVGTVTGVGNEPYLAAITEGK
ncbi:MAG TPA: YncE family protein [Candidatus Baltobacteraceae bacterium]|jgi:DNA-binding beta-propeller fold protein YncE